MFKKLIPVMYWPAAIVFIDDEAEFLETATALFLRNKTYAFSEPKQGVQFINEHSHQVSLEKEFDCNEEDEAKDYLIYLELQSIHKKIHKPERFEELSVLIIDFKMPQGNGLSFIGQVDNPYIKKVLLTGVANNDQAVDAFNSGKIDRYVKKLAKDSDLLLKQYVQELQENYFGDASKTLLDELPDLAKTLQAPKVIEFFNHFISTHKIKEFYLLEETGSFLMHAYDGSQSILCLQTKAARQDVIGALNLRDDVTEEDITPIIEAQKLTTYLFMNSEKSNGNLQQYFFESHPIEGTELQYAHVNAIDVLE